MTTRILLIGLALLLAIPASAEPKKSGGKKRVVNVGIDLDGVILYKAEEKSSFQSYDYKKEQEKKELERAVEKARKKVKKAKKSGNEEQIEAAEAELEEAKVAAAPKPEPEKPKALIVKAAGKKYKVAEGAIPFVQSLVEHDHPDVEFRVTFFSARNRLRNQEALNDIKLPDGRSFAEIAENRIFSRPSMKRLRTGNVKDLNVIPDINLDETIFLDDQLKYINPGQEKSHLWAQFGNTNERLLLSRGIIDRAIALAKERKTSVADALDSLQRVTNRGKQKYNTALEKDPAIRNAGLQAFRKVVPGYEPPKEVEKEKDWEEPAKRFDKFWSEKAERDGINALPMFDKDDFRDLRDFTKDVILPAFPEKDHVFVVAGQDMAPVLRYLHSKGIDARTLPVGNYMFSLKEKDQGPRRKEELTKLFDRFYPNQDELKGRKVALITLDDSDPIALAADIEDYLRERNRPRDLVQGVISDVTYDRPGWSKQKEKGRLKVLSASGFKDLHDDLKRGKFDYVASHPKYDPESDFVEDLTIDAEWEKKVLEEIAELEKDETIKPKSLEERKPKPFVSSKKDDWEWENDRRSHRDGPGGGGRDDKSAFRKGWDFIFGSSSSEPGDYLEHDDYWRESRSSKKSKNSHLPLQPNLTDDEREEIKERLRRSEQPEKIWRDIQRMKDHEALKTWSQRDNEIVRYLAKQMNTKQLIDAVHRMAKKPILNFDELNAASIDMERAIDQGMLPTGSALKFYFEDLNRSKGKSSGQNAKAISQPQQQPGAKPATKSKASKAELTAAEKSALTLAADPVEAWRTLRGQTDPEIAGPWRDIDNAIVRHLAMQKGSAAATNAIMRLVGLHPLKDREMDQVKTRLEREMKEGKIPDSAWENLYESNRADDLVEKRRAKSSNHSLLTESERETLKKRFDETEDPIRDIWLAARNPKKPTDPLVEWTVRDSDIVFQLRSTGARTVDLLEAIYEMTGSEVPPKADLKKLEKQVDERISKGEIISQVLRDIASEAMKGEKPATKPKAVPKSPRKPKSKKSVPIKPCDFEKMIGPEVDYTWYD